MKWKKCYVCVNDRDIFYLGWMCITDTYSFRSRNMLHNFAFDRFFVKELKAFNFLNCYFDFNDHTCNFLSLFIKYTLEIRN